MTTDRTKVLISGEDSHADLESFAESIPKSSQIPFTLGGNIISSSYKERYPGSDLSQVMNPTPIRLTITH